MRETIERIGLPPAPPGTEWHITSPAMVTDKEIISMRDMAAACSLVACDAVSAEHAPTRIMLAPWGMVRSSAGNFNVDAEAAERIVANFVAHGVDVPVDYEHATVGGKFASPDGSAPAAAWISAIEPVRGVGLYATVSWTPRGHQAVAAREYRYVSPVIVVRKSDQRAIELHSVALTNKPAIRNMPAIVNQQATGTAVEAWSEPARTTQAVANRASIIEEANTVYTANAVRPRGGKGLSLSRLCSREAFVDQALRERGMELLSAAEIGTLTTGALDGEWQANAALRQEFGNDKECWLNYKKANDAGLVQILCAADTTRPNAQGGCPIHPDCIPENQWKAHPELRAEFGDDYGAFVAFWRQLNREWMTGGQ